MGYETVSHTGAEGSPGESVERTVDGVTVRKSFETDAFPVPAVVFEISSSRDHAVVLTIVDDVPPEIDMGQVGFHPQYHSDQWKPYPEGRVEFEHELPPQGSITTIYGVRHEGVEEDAFLQHPRVSVGGYQLDEPVLKDVEESDSETATEDVEVLTDTEEEPTEVVREVSDSEPDTVSTTEDEETGVLTDSVRDEEPLRETDELTEVVTRIDESDESGTEQAEELPGTLRDPPETEKATDGSGTAVEHAQGPRMDGSRVVSQLADAIREERVPEEDLAVLEEAFGKSASQTSRVSHLQSRVSDLEAYTDALEAFIDENGTAQQIFEDLQTDLSETSERLDGMETRLDEGDDERSAIEDELAQTKADVETMEEGLSEMEDSVKAVTQDVARIDRAHHELGESIEDLTDVEEQLADLEDQVDEEIEDLAAAVESVREEATTAKDEVDTMLEDVEELQSWRDQLTNVLSADTGGD